LGAESSIKGASFGATDFAAKGGFALLDAFISSTETRSCPANALALSPKTKRVIVLFMAE
jgi:hypothetical protein